MQPVILFDGVCNLCHAAVAWVLERDAKSVFRFASLQSEAAREVLRAAGMTGELPDSVVLVDEEGVHVRSEAALRIAKGLGWPWKLAGVGAVLPGVLRDAVYKTIARNRYRWFGRQETCLVPRPEWSARFLDAGEPIVVVPRVEEDKAESGFLGRWWMLYAALMIFPFPLSFAGDAVPGWSRVTAPWVALVKWVGAKAFGLTVIVEQTGSGDTTFAYLESLLLLGLSLLLAVVVRPNAFWQLAIRTYGRYFLGAMMLLYGFSKLVPMQMPYPGPDKLMQSYGDASPMGLLWTFLGASPAYEMFCGFAEVLGGTLLLFRRTMLAGALVSAIVMLQVLVLNLCYDVPVKLFSMHLLLYSLWMAGPDLPRLGGWIFLGIAAERRVSPGLELPGVWLPRLRRWGKPVLVLLLLVVQPVVLYQSWKPRTKQMREGKFHGIWVVKRFEGGSDADRWLRVGISGSSGIGVMRMDGHVKRYRFQWNQEKSEWLVMQRAQKDALVLKVKEVGEGKVEVEARDWKALLEKEPSGATMLESRGFHWISEMPFNR